MLVVIALATAFIIKSKLSSHDEYVKKSSHALVVGSSLLLSTFDTLICTGYDMSPKKYIADTFGLAVPLAADRKN